jgi:hypothetical protein
MMFSHRQQMKNTAMLIWGHLAVYRTADGGRSSQMLSE